jgi:hypothetical protein
MIGDGSILYHMTGINDLIAGIILCGVLEDGLARTAP